MYGAPFDSAHIKDLIQLADYFQYEELAAECANFPLYKLGASVQHATWIIEEFFHSFSLLKKDTFMQDDRLKEAFLWFAVHFNDIVKLELDLLSSIPMDWLRFVFGEAPCHCFESETDRLDKAIAFYLRMGHSDELFSALFEKIRYACIPLTELLSRKYSFLYRTPNETVRRQMMRPRGAALPLDQLKTHFGSMMFTYYSESWTRQRLFGENFEVVFQRKERALSMEITSFLSEPHSCDISGYLLMIKEKGCAALWEPFTCESKEPKSKQVFELPSVPSFLTGSDSKNVKYIVHVSEINISTK
jgi:hypothetical protein